MNNSSSIYIGMSLTHATHEFREQFGVALPRLLTRAGFDVLPFVGLTSGTSEEVYATDMEHATNADYMLALCDMPSIGLGMELQTRIGVGRPLIVAWKRGMILSRMVTGAILRHKLTTCAYKDISDIVRTCSNVDKELRTEHRAA